MTSLRGPVLGWSIVCSALLVPVSVAPTPPPWRIGVLLWHQSPNDREALLGIRNALRISGRPHEIVLVEADSDPLRARDGITRLRAEHVDLVFALGTEAALACKEAIADLPVVFTAVTNPVESGVVPSWDGSGSNLAGNSNWIGSRTVLDLFGLAVPNLRTLGVLRSAATGKVSAAELAAMRDMLDADTAPTIALREEVAHDVDDLVPAFDRLAAERVQAVWIPIDFLVYENIERVAEAASRHGIPLVSSSLRGVKEAAIAGLVVDYEMLGERAVLIALDILEKGIAPGTIPVGRMAGYQIVVNLAAAHRLRYRVPLPLLAIADLLIDPESERKR